MSPFTFRHITASQGCEGGYAFLAARWASDVGLVPKNCSDEDPQVGDVTVAFLGRGPLGTVGVPKKPRKTWGVEPRKLGI